VKPLSILVFRWCPEGDLNPHALLGAADFKCVAYALKLLQTKQVILRHCESVQENV
jgi:hypothetical protein